MIQLALVHKWAFMRVEIVAVIYLFSSIISID